MKEIYKYLNVIGSDETGVGDYLTPLVACACFLDYKNSKDLELIGVKDSKKLSDSKILNLAKEIKKVCNYKIAFLDQNEYNILNKDLNANELKMLLHIKAINEIEKEEENANMIIIDQFSTKESIKKYYKKLGSMNFNLKRFKAKIKVFERAESEHVAVAAASILAREFLLNFMKEQNKKYGLVFPLGTNKIVEDFSKEFVNKFGKKELKNVAKISFKTTKKIIF